MNTSNIEPFEFFAPTCTLCSFPIMQEPVDLDNYLVHRICANDLVKPHLFKQQGDLEITEIDQLLNGEEPLQEQTSLLIEALLTQDKKRNLELSTLEIQEGLFKKQLTKEFKDLRRKLVQNNNFNSLLGYYCLGKILHQEELKQIGDKKPTQLLRRKI